MTELVPNERIGFHSVMPNGWGISAYSELCIASWWNPCYSRWQLTKLPAAMFLMRLLVPIVGGRINNKFLKNMKSDLEQSPKNPRLQPKTRSFFDV